MTSSIQRFSMFPEISMQQPQSVYDLIQQLEKDLNPVLENIAPSLEENKLEEEIAFIEREIKAHHLKAQNKYDIQKIQQEAQRAIFQQQLQELKTQRPVSVISQAASTMNDDSLRELEQEIQQLLIERTALCNHNQRTQHSPLRHRRTEILSSSTHSKLEESQSRISQSQTQIQQLETAHHRQMNRHEVFDAQINNLEETYNQLLKKQEYFRAETNKYREAIIQKTHQRDHALSVYAVAQDRVNSLVARKKKFLADRIQEFKHFSEEKLKEMQENYGQQLTEQKRSVTSRLADNRSQNQASNVFIEQLKKQQVEQAKIIQDTHIQKIKENLNDYFNYLNRTEFALYNPHYDEYLYAATYSRPSLKDDERRWVYTWRPKGCPTQGGWQLIQYTDGTFGLKNTTHLEYLYAANYKPGCYPENADRRLAFTWKPGNQVREGYWKLQLILGEENTFKIFNTDHQGYLYPEADQPRTRAADDERRPIHVGRNTYIPGNEGKWVIRELKRS